ncbi:Uncharacterised protein [Mycolicibacterium vanbaalenii]|uniref:Uncharacterized protein n=1 Tax=Mycolicibacterium vanbaalenii TaxID=110539 RepID=A0A5S9R3T7_MYCVN|nr:hypothetical protein [Mycolicibacterium vanbaalenii]CAA0126576.1 Uncharacterised protein [Mycolicibacterium vanbaalenii]
MADALADIFLAQFGLLDVEVWVELFAGGAGAGLHLLDRGVVDEVWLTEKNRELAAFWRTVVDNGVELAGRVRACQPDMSTWHTAREVVASSEAGAAITDLELAFAALIINRCSPNLFGGSLAVYGREEADPIVGGRRSWPPLVGSVLLFDVLLHD